MSKLFVAALLASAHLASADSLAAMVQNRISASAEAEMGMESGSLVMGTENCVNKCVALCLPALSGELTPRARRCQKRVGTTAFSGQVRF